MRKCILDYMNTNPIRDYRKRNGHTIEEFAKACGVHWQAVFLNEQGVYPHVLPRILRKLVDWGANSLIIQGDYNLYQRNKRETNGVRFCLGAVILPAPTLKHPVVAFRDSLSISRMLFCKLFCVHPAEMSRLESGEKHTFSEQFKQAMLQAGLPATVLDELEFRCGEYAQGEWVSGETRVN
jgi:hypothetical protein